MVFSAEDRNGFTVKDNKIFKHEVLQINYTIYDLRRDYDSVKKPDFNHTRYNGPFYRP